MYSHSLSGSLLRLLIVDDDMATRALYREYLEADRTKNYEVSEVGDAEAGAQLVREQDFHCILLDYNLPGMNGLNFLDLLRATPERPGPPVIMLTGCGNEDIVIDCIHKGAADYIPKHKVSTVSLCRAIENAVEKDLLRKQIAEQTLALRNTNRELLAKNAEIQRFYHAVSHEIKTPLTAAREFVSIVLDGIVGETSEQQREILTYAIASCDEIAIHFNDLVDCARLGTGKLTLRKRPCDIGGVIKRSVTGVAPAIKAKEIVVEQNVEAGLPDLHMDPGRIVQVLSNLMSNAIKYSGHGERIEVFARRSASGKYIEVGVSDRGEGIAEDHLPHIFERLYQARAADDQMACAGLGLGLTIAKEIIELHGGNITVASKPGEGSTFTVRLPLTIAAQDDSPCSGSSACVTDRFAAVKQP